jgi:hypothetical protein
VAIRNDRRDYVKSKISMIMICKNAFIVSMASTVLPFFHKSAKMAATITIAESSIPKNEGETIT